MNFKQMITRIESLPLSYEVIELIDPNFQDNVLESGIEDKEELAAHRVNETLRFMHHYLKLLKATFLKSNESIYVMQPYICDTKIKAAQEWIDDANEQLAKGMDQFKKDFPNPTQEQQESVDDQLEHFGKELQKAYDLIEKNEQQKKNIQLFIDFNNAIKDHVELDGDNNMIKESEEIQSIMDSMYYDDGVNVNPTEETGVLCSMIFYKKICKTIEDHHNEEYDINTLLEEFLEELD